MLTRMKSLKDKLGTVVIQSKAEAKAEKKVELKSKKK